MNNVKINSYGKSEFKRRLPAALLAGITSSFTFFFFGIIEIFSANRDEFLFSFGDFGGYCALIAVISAAIVCALILFLPGKLSALALGIISWLTVTGYLQSLFLNGSGSLGADSGNTGDKSFIIVDTVIWIVTGIIIIGAALMMHKKDFIRPAFIIVLVAVLAMVLTSCITQIVSTNSGKSNVSAKNGSAQESTEDTETEDVFLTKNGLDKVSKKNIVIFLIDRFDVNFYNSAIEEYPDLFDGLDGFTYFSDNISLYSRTYPAVTTMLTGIDNDFSGSAADYFEKAYKESPFLNDLKGNGWAIKLYTQNYYCYRDGAVLDGVADNISLSKGYVIKDQKALINRLIKLSVYRYSPNIVKDKIKVSSASFAGIVDLDGDYSLYDLDDPAVCGQILAGGVSLDTNEKALTFIHLSGCHYPYTMDENANASEDSSAEKQLCGCMKMIYRYIDGMKELGVYDDSTIIITGDHPSAVKDSVIPKQSRLTALFVKPAGTSGDPLKFSGAQVSQQNLIPTIIKSAGIATDKDYGLSYFEVPEDQNSVRYHKFQLSIDSNKVTQIVTMEVTGDGADFSNWKVIDKKDIGALYK